MANFYTDNTDLKFHLGHPLMKKISGVIWILAAPLPR